MSKGMMLFLGVLAAGMAQFGILVGAGADKPLILCAGVIGAMGTTLIGLLKQLPREKWEEEKQ